MQQGLLPNPLVNLTTNFSSHAPRGNHRGGHSFSPSHQPSQPQHSKPTCQVCQKIGHVALQCYHRFDQAYQYEPPRSMSTHYTNSQSLTDKEWYPDSAATNHIMSDFQNLNISTDIYSGFDQIKVGDGTVLPITHFDDSFLSSSQSKFLLCNLLFVPQITKILFQPIVFVLIMLYFFEFHDSFFYVKDK